MEDMSFSARDRSRVDDKKSEAVVPVPLYPSLTPPDKRPVSERAIVQNTPAVGQQCWVCGKHYKKSHRCKQRCGPVEGLTGVVYLVQPSTLWCTHSNIFKIGRSNQLTLARVASYGPNPAPHALASVQDPVGVESALIAAFDAEFTCVRGVGREYYSGSIVAMQGLFFKTVAAAAAASADPLGLKSLSAPPPLYPSLAPAPVSIRSLPRRSTAPCAQDTYCSGRQERGAGPVHPPPRSIDASRPVRSARASAAAADEEDAPAPPRQLAPQEVSPSISVLGWVISELSSLLSGVYITNNGGSNTQARESDNIRHT